MVGVGAGVVLTACADAPTIQILPSESTAAEVAISLFAPPNLKFHNGAPVLEKVEINPSLLPFRFPEIQLDVAFSVVPIMEIEVGVKSRSLTCSFPVYVRSTLVFVSTTVAAVAFG